MEFIEFVEKCEEELKMTPIQISLLLLDRKKTFEELFEIATKVNLDRCERGGGDESRSI